MSPQIELGSAPERVPSPRSYWIDLHPINDYTDAGPLSKLSSDVWPTQSVPEAPPVPFSYWIDLFPVGDSDGKESIPDVSPEPASFNLELHPEAALTAIQEADDTRSAFVTESPLESNDDVAVSLMSNMPTSISNLDQAEEALTAGQESAVVEKREFEQQAIEPSMCPYPDCMPDGTRYMATSDADMDHHYEQYHAHE